MIPDFRSVQQQASQELSLHMTLTWGGGDRRDQQASQELSLHMMLTWGGGDRRDPQASQELSLHVMLTWGGGDRRDQLYRPQEGLGSHHRPYPPKEDGGAVTIDPACRINFTPRGVHDRWIPPTSSVSQNTSQSVTSALIPY